ncbi:MAG: phosphoglucosamine mutase [Microscillaceae bacterium]|nr:phosphoglucosamine mutase [Microscillaceae bacterium]
MTLIKSISGIRGTLGGKNGETLSPLDIVRFSAAYGTWIRQVAPTKKVILGRDARISGEMLSSLVSSTLRAMGIDILDLGLSTTPTVEIAVGLEKAGGGIMISASHNPIQWNALKLLNHEGEFLSQEESQKVLDWADQGEFEFEEPKKIGHYQMDNSYLDKHIEMILNLALTDLEAIQKRKFKVIVDAVNSTGGIAIPKLLAALGVEEVKELYCEPNGLFPHNPEPLSENLTDIARELEKGGYDLGIVVDPDVDRLAFVCEDGSMFGEEYTLVAIADYVLKHQPGATVSNLSSTRALKDITQKAGQIYEASAVGEAHVVAKMKEISAVIGGEGNGGVIYPTLHYGRDALVGIALFLSHLAHFAKPVSQFKGSYPKYQISKNKISLTPDIDMDYVLNQIEEKYKNNPINRIDGVKIEFEDSWAHLRKSNTEPIIRIYSEADSLTTADNIANKIIQDVKEILNNLDKPY